MTEITTPVYNTYEDYNYDDLNIYAGLDCIATSKVLSKIFPKLAEEPSFITSIDGNSPIYTKLKSLIDVNEEVTLPALDYILDMEINGMKYDTSKNREFHSRMTEEICLLKDDIFRMVGHEVDMNSGVKMAEFLYGEKGFTIPYTTTSGEPSTDGDALLSLAGLNPLDPGRYITPNPDLQYLAWMAKYKDIFSSHNMFIKNYVEDFVKSDGRIHASYNLHGTSSFRITGDNPNFTQLPRPKHGYNIRECYTVDEGNVFMAFDFSSAEVKILANICKDPSMLKAVADGLDFHSFSASAMLGVPYAEFVDVLKNKDNENYKRYKSLRQIAKVLTFSILYGSSANGIAMQLGITKDESEKYMDMYFKAYPKMADYIERQKNWSIWNKMIVTPFGQRRQEYGVYDCFKKTAAYNAAVRNSSNVGIQSPTSTLGLITFAELNKSGMKPLGAKAICTVNHCGLI